MTKSNVEAAINKATVDTMSQKDIDKTALELGLSEVQVEGQDYNDFVAIKDQIKELEGRKRDLEKNILAKAEATYVENSKEYKFKTLSFLISGLKKKITFTFAKKKQVVQSSLVDQVKELGVNVEEKSLVEFNNDFATEENIEKLVKLVGQARFKEWFSVKKEFTTEDSKYQEKFYNSNIFDAAVKTSKPSVSVK